MATNRIDDNSVPQNNSETNAPVQVDFATSKNQRSENGLSENCAAHTDKVPTQNGDKESVFTPFDEAESEVNKPTDAQQQIIYNLIKKLTQSDVVEDDVETAADGKSVRRIIKNSDGDRIIVLYDKECRIKSVEIAYLKGNFQFGSYGSGYTHQFKYENDNNILVTKEGRFHFEDDPDGAIADDGMDYPKGRIDKNGRQSCYYPFINEWGEFPFLDL